MIDTKAALRDTAQSLLKLIESGVVENSASSQQLSAESLPNRGLNRDGFDIHLRVGNNTADTIADFFIALNELNIAHGGLGFRYQNLGADEARGGAYKIRVTPITVTDVEPSPSNQDKV